MVRATPALLDAANAEFIQGGVSMLAGSCDKAHMPRLARALGCRVSSDRRRVTVFFPKSRSLSLLEALAEGGPFAVTFSLPSTHRTIQLKGKAGVFVDVGDRDIALIGRYVDAFVADVCPLGYPEPLIRMLLWYAPNDVAAVDFTPDHAYQQTPGPRAGTPLKTEC